MKASYWKIVSLCVALSLLALLSTAVSADAPRRSVAEALPMMRVAKFDGHMRTPHEGQIINLLREHRVVRPDASAEELRAAIDEFMVEWAKRNPTTVNPEKLRQLLSNERLAAEAGKSPKAMGLAVQDMKVLIALVEFPGEDTFTITVDNPDYDPEDPESPECIEEEVTTSGPLHNEIVLGPRDNNNFWMSDFNPDVYDELFFGVGPEAGVIADHPNVGDVDLRGYTVANYFLEQSEGTFVPEGYVYPKWLQAAHSEGWYGYDDCVTGSRYPRARDLVRETVDLINADDPEFSWQDFDSDGDGLVDSYTVVHSGMGQEAGGGAQGGFSLWSHSASINWPDGYLACEAGSVGCPDRDIHVLDYGMDPENADTGVLAEEFGHAAWGLPDIYTTDYQASVANWSLMEAGAWNGPLGGMIPAPFAGWMRYVVGWWDPVVVEYDDPETETMIGQLSLRPEGTEQGMKVNLPDAVRFLQDPYAGEYMWWGGQGDLMDNAVRHTVDLTDKTEASVGFWTFFEIEEGWDFGFVQVSTDGGQTWTSLENEDTTSEHDPGAIDTVLANLPGLTGSSDDWVYEEFDLTPYVGQEIWLQFRYITDWGTTERGFFIDDITITADDEDIFFDDVEAGPGDWVADPEDGWVITTGTDRGVQYYLVEWRNSSGFDEGLQYPYQTVYSDEDDWEVDRGPYTVPGMLLYHRNTLYAFDYALGDSWYDAPSWGPRHALLVVDSHRFPYTFDDYYYESGQNIRLSGRVTAGDAAFTLQETTPFTIRLGYDPETGEYVEDPLEEKEFGPQPAVSAFHDSMGYYPGLWCCDAEGYLYFWDIDASAVVPSSADYSTKITWDDNTPAYDLYGVWGILGSGNPGDDAVQYGVHLEVVDQAEDGSWGQVRFWNSIKELDSSLEVDATEAMKDDVLTYTCLVEENIGSAVDALAVTWQCLWWSGARAERSLRCRAGRAVCRRRDGGCGGTGRRCGYRDRLDRLDPEPVDRRRSG
jgi:immune inhibitor A